MKRVDRIKKQMDIPMDYLMRDLLKEFGTPPKNLTVIKGLVPDSAVWPVPEEIVKYPVRMDNDVT